MRRFLFRRSQVRLILPLFRKRRVPTHDRGRFPSWCWVLVPTPTREVRDGRTCTIPSSRQRGSKHLCRKKVPSPIATPAFGAPLTLDRNRWLGCCAMLCSQQLQHHPRFACSRPASLFPLELLACREISVIPRSEINYIRGRK